MLSEVVRLAIGIVLVVLLISLACQAPGPLADILPQGTESPASKTEVGEVGTQPPATRAGDDAYPDPQTPAPSQTLPAVDGGDVATPGDAYPPPETQPVEDDTRATATQDITSVSATPDTDDGDPYPGPEETGSAPSPTATQLPAATPSLTPQPTATQTLGGTQLVSPTATELLAATPTATQVLLITPTPTDVMAVTPTPTEILAITPTATSGASATPTLAPTATPSPTPTPTPTWTPVVYPPWLTSQLRATDPSTVQLAANKVQLIWFFAFWDGPSQAMASMVHGLEEQYGERMNFVYLDIDDPATDVFKDELGYKWQPHFFLLDREGRILLQWQGYVNVDSFVQAFDAALQ